MGEKEPTKYTIMFGQTELGWTDDVTIELHAPRDVYSETMQKYFKQIEDGCGTITVRFTIIDMAAEKFRAVKNFILNTVNKNHWRN